MAEPDYKRMFEDLDRTYGYFTREYRALKEYVGTIDSKPVVFESRVRLLADELVERDKQLVEYRKEIAQLTEQLKMKDILLNHDRDALLRDERWMNWSTAMWAAAILLSYWLPYLFGRTP